MVDQITTFDPFCLRVAPGVPSCAEFDLCEVERALGEIESGVPGQCREDLARAVRAVVVWLCEPRQRGQLSAEQIGRRCAALGYLVTPEVFENKSLNKLAKQLGASLSAISRDSADARRRFGLAGNAYSAHSRHSFKSSK